MAVDKGRIAPENDIADSALRELATKKQAVAELISRYTVDMNNAPPSSAKTALGFNRNGPWFWRTLRQQHPEMFSPENVRFIKQGKSPSVDEQWVKYNPQHAEYMGQKLIHHHIDQGRFAAGLPENVHTDSDSLLHSRTTD